MSARTTPVALLIILTLSGCAAPAAPVMEGPWAAEFQQEYEKATDPFIRAVLVDGTVTDQEYTEMWEKFDSCMAAAGVSVSEVRDDGSYSTDFAKSLGADAANAADNRCSMESGEYPIGALYSWVRRNPDHRDENEIGAACLVRKGAVPEGYDTDDFARDAPTQAFPYLDKDLGPALLRECSDDPLGLFT